ncbi:hypothetical protein ACFY0F_09150 [Streptomyces sp. NPDC001544]|uniref:hypothetical protein n=1 Tax=Streptomyces sp. NPDC001544 TaxID=3364584 RepID=UPI0036766E7F
MAILITVGVVLFDAAPDRPQLLALLNPFSRDPPPWHRRGRSLRATTTASR